MLLEKKQLAEILGTRVRELRLEKGITIEKLALDAEMQYAHLSRIEHGKINTTVFQIYKISKSLNQPIANFFLNIEFPNL